jgi:putative glutamine amidotransferase
VFVGGHDYPPEIYNEPRHEKVETMDERRAEYDLLLFKLAFERKIPIVGICAGMQLINISMEGKLIQHLDNHEFHQPENYHTLTIKNSKWLSQIFPDETIVVNSLHHQGVKPEYLGKDLNAVAFAPDGLIECVEYNGEQVCMGVQWHPERVSASYLKASSFLGKKGARRTLNEHTSRFFNFIVKTAQEYLDNKENE